MKEALNKSREISILGCNSLQILKITFKGSSDPSNFIFEIIDGKSRIRHRTTLKLNFQIYSKLIGDVVIQIQSRSMSDPTISDIDFKNKMALV